MRGASPTFKAVLADMQAVHASVTPLPKYWLLQGRRYLRLQQDKAHPYGIIATAAAGPDGRPGAWRTVFDLDAYNRAVSGSYTIRTLFPESDCLAPSFDRCMIPLWYEGGQDNAYIELDLAAGQVVKDGFHIAPGRNFVSWFDRDTLLVAHTTDGARTLLNQFPAELHVWTRGTPLSRAPKIFALGATDVFFTYHVIGGPAQMKIVVNDVKSYTKFQLKELTLDGRVTDLPLPEQLGDFGTPVFMRGRLAVQLATEHRINGRTYPADTVVAYDFATKRVSVVMAPPPGVYLSGGITGLKDGFAVVGGKSPSAYALLCDARWCSLDRTSTADGTGWTDASSVLRRLQRRYPPARGGSDDSTTVQGAGRLAAAGVGRAGHA